MKYKASLDKTAKAVTIAVTILFATIIIGQYSLITDEGRHIPIFTTATLVIIYFGVFGFSTTGYSITTGKIIIHRLFGNVNIERAEIETVELLDKEKLRWSVRIFAVGGLFGYFGKFVNRKIGKMTWFATRRDMPVLLITRNHRNIILTPDDAKQFVTALNA